MNKTIRQTAKEWVLVLMLGCFFVGLPKVWCLGHNSETSQKKNPILAWRKINQETLKPSAKSAESSLPQKTSVGVIKGRIQDYETQKPLAGVTVAVLKTDLEVESNENGIYTFPEIPVGYYVVAFKFEGYYSDTRTDVIVRSGRNTFLNVEMLMAHKINEDVTVAAGYFPTTPSKTGSQFQFNAEELRRDAASAGDVSRALHSVPGTLKSDEEYTDLIVRGGSPLENGYYVDNIFVPNVNHFPQAGASGGTVSMLNMDFIKGLNVYTGGFDATYGNRLSSIIDIRYREGNRERINSQINLSAIGFSAQLEGPLFNKKGSWMFSANKSYLDILQGLMGEEGEVGNFYDIQGKITYDINASNSLSLLTIIGVSKIEEDREYEAEVGEIYYDFEKYNVSTFGLTWRHLWGSKGYSDTSLSYSFIDSSQKRWNIADDDLHGYLKYRNGWMTFRNTNNLQLSAAHQLKFGIEAQNMTFTINDSYDYVERRFSGSSGAVFLDYVVYPFENFSLSAGMRIDYVPLSERFHFSPRLSFSWMMSKRLSIHGAFGIFFQQMPLFLLKQHPENIKLRDPKARHLVLGFKYLLRDDTLLSLEAYDKQYSNFPMCPDWGYYFIMDDVGGRDTVFRNWGCLTDKGKAYVRGVEFSIQKKLFNKLYGLINLTYYRTRFQDLTGTWRNRAYDNRYIICLSGGYKPNKNWEFNLRWILCGNKAFNTVDEEQSIQEGRAVLDFDNIMNEHMSDYHTLSLRCDRRFYFKKSNLVVFLGVMNILDRRNELYRMWDTRLNDYRSLYMWGRMPYIGFEFEF